MVDSVGKAGGLAREAILAALRSQAQIADGVRERIGDVSAQVTGAETRRVDEGGFAEQLGRGVEAVDAEIRRTENLPEEMLTGKVDDFHEVAVQIKEAEIGFRFAMEIRNKLIDAYREVMRMTV